MLLPIAIATGLLAVLDDDSAPPDFEDLFQRAVAFERPEILLDTLTMEQRQEVYKQIGPWAREASGGGNRVKIMHLFLLARAADRSKAFEKVAEDVARKGIEGSIRKLMHSQIAQDYSYTVDRAGSILNRMCQDFTWFHGNEGAVQEKVNSVRRSLRDYDRFRQTIDEQIKNNVESHKEEGKPFHDYSKAKAKKSLLEIAKNVADTYRGIVVYNRMQYLARELVVDLCEMKLAAANEKLREIDKTLNSGLKIYVEDDGRQVDEWEVLSGEWNGLPYEPS